MKNMKNPIVDNRIVSDIHFAVRLKSFIEKVQVNSPMLEEEKNALLNVCVSLLKYQTETATETNEIEYLKRTGNFIEPKILVTTQDGYNIFDTIFDVPFEEGKNPILYSVMNNPNIDEKIVPLTIKSKQYLLNLNPNRLLFVKKENAEIYLDMNMKRFSKIDFNKLIAFEQEKNSTTKELSTNEPAPATAPNEEIQDECDCYTCVLNRALIKKEKQKFIKQETNRTFATFDGYTIHEEILKGGKITVFVFNSITKKISEIEIMDFVVLFNLLNDGNFIFYKEKNLKKELKNHTS